MQIITRMQSNYYFRNYDVIIIIFLSLEKLIFRYYVALNEPTRRTYNQDVIIIVNNHLLVDIYCLPLHEYLVN